MFPAMGHERVPGIVSQGSIMPFQNSQFVTWCRAVYFSGLYKAIFFLCDSKSPQVQSKQFIVALHFCAEIANENPLLLLGQYSDDEADGDEFGTGSLHDADSSEAKKETLEYEDDQVVVQNQVSGDSGLEEREERSISPTGSNQETSKEVLLSDTDVQEIIPKIEWQPVFDERSEKYYYWNVQNGETTWVNPIERASPDGSESFDVQPVEMHPSTGLSAEHYPKVQMDLQDGHRDFSDGERTIPSEECNIQHPDKVVSCGESTEIELNNSNVGLISGKNYLADAVCAAEERIEDAKDPDSTGELVDFPQDNGILEEEQGKKREESVLKIMDDEKGIDFENACNSQGISGKHMQEIESGKRSRMSPITVDRTQPLDNVQDALICSKTLPPTGEARKIKEEMASLIEKIESLTHQLSTFSSHESRHSFAEVSRHALMVSQIEARLNDWKTFCALGFAPEACLSIMQKELIQLEQDVTAGKAKAFKKQKLMDPVSKSEGFHEDRLESREPVWPLNCTYYQHADNEGVKPSVHGHPTQSTGKIDDVEEGEIHTFSVEAYPAYEHVSEVTTAFNAQRHSSGGDEDVDMDVDMEVDEEVEAEPAVPGSDVPLSDIPVTYPYLYTQSDLGSTDLITLTHLDACATPYFQTEIAGYSWAPPLPPDDEWAPPPPGESESAPPPPPDEPPPFPPQSAEGAESLSFPSIPSDLQLQYYLPEYSVSSNSVAQSVSAVADYQSIVDPSGYGSYVDGVVYSNIAQSTEHNPYGDGVIYSNSTQSAETLTAEQPYMVASGPTLAFNGWAPAVTPTASSLVVNPLSSKAPVKSASSAPATTSMAVDSTVIGANLEIKKPVKGKVKKRTPSVAAAPMLNKKVSSLVNKWKQAKEELHGGDDEEDDRALYDVELLEKKRQKEIEEWRRQQIASGEALDNANFQPLGALDWRERVKRARRLESKEGKEETTGSLSPSTVVEGTDGETVKSKKPNLMDLSKGLPAGWQAYWDETSGEVYYGNLITQETTWDRPSI